jgi:hypothetical protein
LDLVRNLNQSLPTNEKQAAYYVFEEIAGIEHLHKSVKKALTESSRYMHDSTKELVKTYSSAEDIDDARREREKMLSLGMTMGTSILLTAGGIGGVTPYIGLPQFLATGTQMIASVNKAISVFNAGLNLVTGTYIAITGLAAKARENP